MRKFLLLLCACCMFGINAHGAEPTTDHFTVSNAELIPNGIGGDVCITIGVEGSRKYTAYNLDITLPAGVDVYNEDGDYWVIMDEDEGVYPFTKKAGKKSFTHSVSFSYGVVGERILRVSCMSTLNESFTETSGNLLQIYLVASPYAKPGLNSIKISGGNLTAVENGDVNKYVPDDQSYDVLTVGTTSTLNLNINSGNQYSTCVLPFDFTPSGFQAFSPRDIEDGYLNLSEVTTMTAYTPYIIYSATGYSNKLTGEVDAAKYDVKPANGYLYGAIEPQTITSGFVLQNQGDGAMFYKVNGTAFTIPAGKCWLMAPATLGEWIEFKPATGIDHIYKNSAAPNAVFDMSGNPVVCPQPGNIYVKNGKKVLKLK